MTTKTLAIGQDRYLICQSDRDDVTLLMLENETPEDCVNRFIKEEMQRIANSKAWLAKLGRIDSALLAKSIGIAV